MQDDSSPNSPTLAPIIDAGLTSTALATPRLDESSPKPPMLALTSDVIELIGVSNSTPRPDESPPVPTKLDNVIDPALHNDDSSPCWPMRAKHQAQTSCRVQPRQLPFPGIAPPLQCMRFNPRRMKQIFQAQTLTLPAHTILPTNSLSHRIINGCILAPLFKTRNRMCQMSYPNSGPISSVVL
ncbi:unnamed protein product [Sphacelaria rigidula]